MANVVIGDNESFDSLLKRFNKRVQQDGILSRCVGMNTTKSPAYGGSGSGLPRDANQLG